MVARYVVTVVTEEVTDPEQPLVGSVIQELIGRRLRDLHGIVYYDIFDQGRIVDEKTTHITQVKIEYEP